MRALGTTLVVLLLVTGAAFIGYARWSRAVADGDAALGGGQPERAVAEYQAAEGRFDGIPAVRQLAAGEYSRVMGNHLLALYRLKRFDDVVDLSQKAPVEAQPHFWAGAALFQKAVIEEKPDARLGWLTRAEEEFRKAIETAPGDWDTKYDFELTTRLAAELRKQPTTPPKQLMQLLRPPTPGQKTPRKVG